MNGYTKGPWILDDDSSNEPMVRSEQTAVIIAVRHRLPRAESKENMRLIAAAPELLEALKELSREEFRDDDDPILGQARLNARLAIAKAEAA